MQKHFNSQIFNFLSLFFSFIFSWITGRLVEFIREFITWNYFYDKWSYFDIRHSHVVSTINKDQKWLKIEEINVFYVLVKLWSIYVFSVSIIFTFQYHSKKKKILQLMDYELQTDNYRSFRFSGLTIASSCRQNKDHANGCQRYRRTRNLKKKKKV